MNAAEAARAPQDPTPASSPLHLQDLQTAVQFVLDRVQGPVHLALPLGIGKPNAWVNVLYERMAADAARPLRILTALSLEKPSGQSDLERHFLDPLVARVFGNYPDLLYVKAARAQTLPAHIEVREFFLKTGDYLGNDAAQQGFICSNYSLAVRDMLAQGANVIAQAVAVCTGPDGRPRYSLSCNPDLTADFVEQCRAQGRPLLTVAVLNRELPFMPGPAEVTEDFFDLIVDAPEGHHALFAPPNPSVSTADNAIGLHAASLVADGGTLQIGIGSLGDAIAQALLLRDRNNSQFREALAALDAAAPYAARQLGRFEQGLYGCSEMFVNGLLQLLDAGVIRRAVYPDLGLQTLANRGELPATPTPAAAHALVARGLWAPQLTATTLTHGQAIGLLNAALTLDDATQTLQCANQRWPNDLRQLPPEALGTQWRGTAVLHGGFFLGPRAFYERLRDMPDALRNGIAMSRIGVINELYDSPGHPEALKRAQRRQARFINTTMKMTLLGAASSDATADGRVVSGVGGQYNFVAQAHALPDARSVLALRATHDNAAGLKSNLVWSHGNCTIPRHLRDLVVTEYGVADLRGASDAECIQRLLCIADSRFQDALMREAQAHGKLAPNWRLPEHARHNTPEALKALLRPAREAGALPDFPFGTDLDADEIRIVRALRKLKHASHHPLELVHTALASLSPHRAVPPAYLERLGLAEAHGLRDLLLKRLLAASF
ncbi:acetyl-CoA hydrolase/transferase C-terminal domain-containing protein [Roseateles sp. BYS87W]|uniref:Acetyl-CoA hydrolase/transferase C-terminal domain-containing protein n=1 Tax=Pelomonas baiyunensis TaxID=3299026 RepID=A0ABW7GY73_9BURK